MCGSAFRRPDPVFASHMKTTAREIPHKEKELIFDHEYGQHTGMGLFLAREILAITGISITECGVCGEGARFEISVPQGGYCITPERTGWD